jgi:hypothetical protein
MTKLPTLAMTALLVAACGGKTGAPPIGSHGGSPRGPVLVFRGLGDKTMFEAACGGADCADLRTRSMDGTQLVSSRDATFRITGTVSDDCDASGATDVIAIERASGAPDATVDVAVFPADATIDLEQYTPSSPAVGADVKAALARVATADVVSTEHPATITPDEITVVQLVTTNVDDDPAPDLLIAAEVPKSDEDGPGYVWSALVLVPGGNYDAATSVWTSDLEHMTIDGSFDLEGDGKRELLYSAEYYEGSGLGAAIVTDGALEMLGSWGCGA